MRLTLILAGMLVLSGCATTVMSGRTDVLCGLDAPTFTQVELERLSDQSLEELDNFLEKRRAICEA
jgi:hypothetical protein